MLGEEIAEREGPVGPFRKHRDQLPLVPERDIDGKPVHEIDAEEHRKPERYEERQPRCIRPHSIVHSVPREPVHTTRTRPSVDIPPRSVKAPARRRGTHAAA